jgi:hypothetical protein
MGKYRITNEAAGISFRPGQSAVDIYELATQPLIVSEAENVTIPYLMLTILQSILTLWSTNMIISLQMKR